MTGDYKQYLNRIRAFQESNKEEIKHLQLMGVWHGLSDRQRAKYILMPHVFERMQFKFSDVKAIPKSPKFEKRFKQ